MLDFLLWNKIARIDVYKRQVWCRNQKIYNAQENYHSRVTLWFDVGIKRYTTVSYTHLVNRLLEEGKIDQDTEIHIEFARELNDANKRNAIAAYTK